MDVTTRVAVGAAGIAICGLLLQQGMAVPPYEVIPGTVIGGALAVWGFWPAATAVWHGLTSWWRVSLVRALQICHERCERTRLGEWVNKVNETPQQKLNYYWSSFTVNFVPVFGEKPPSSIAFRIPADALKNLHLREGTSDLAVLGDSKRLLYRNAYVRRFDLLKHVRYLKRESKHGRLS
jgi:antitoxin component of MazEF toxin-antitoxin module